MPQLAFLSGFQTGMDLAQRRIQNQMAQQEHQDNLMFQQQQLKRQQEQDTQAATEFNYRRTQVEKDTILKELEDVSMQHAIQGGQPGDLLEVFAGKGITDSTTVASVLSRAYNGAESLRQKNRAADSMIAKRESDVKLGEDRVAVSQDRLSLDQDKLAASRQKADADRASREKVARDRIEAQIQIASIRQSRTGGMVDPAVRAMREQEFERTAQEMGVVGTKYHAALKSEYLATGKNSPSLVMAALKGDKNSQEHVRVLSLLERLSSQRQKAAARAIYMNTQGDNDPSVLDASLEEMRAAEQDLKLVNEHIKSILTPVPVQSPPSQTTNVPGGSDSIDALIKMLTPEQLQKILDEK